MFAENASFNTAVSGLVLNFIPEPGQAVSEMARVVKPGGVVAAYVWDYAGKMQFMHHFWDAAATLNPQAADLDEGRLYSFGGSIPLVARAWARAGCPSISAA